MPEGGIVSLPQRPYPFPRNTHHPDFMSLARFLTRLFRRRKPAAAPPEAPTFEAALHRLKGRNISVSTVIDVGASNGCWSQALLPVYPQARYLCVEAQRVHEPALRAFVTRHANAEFVPDLQPADVDARTRALADVCLVLLNSNEFAYVY